MSSPTSSVDVIVLAGTHTDKGKLIRGRNKAFLPVGEGLSLGLVLEALRGARGVGRIFVVGPEVLLGDLLPPERCGYRPVPEAGRMLDNAWKAFEAAESSLGLAVGDPALADRPYLFLTSDVPLAVSEAIDDFLERCFALEEAQGERIDFFAGLADEAALAPFYPRGQKKGIRRPYMELKHQRMRLANIYLVRPRSIGNREVLQQGFTARKLTRWRNILRLLAVFLRNPGGLHGVLHVLCFQAAALLESAGMHGLSAVPRAFLDLRRVERTASLILGCRFSAVVTPFGGLSIDIDEESDYEILSENLDAWREHQRTLIPPLDEAPRTAHASAPPEPTAPPPATLL